MIVRSDYEPRPVRPLGLLRVEGWCLKLYGVAYRTPTPRSELVLAAKSLAPALLPGGGGATYGVGFMGIHDGRNSCFVFVDWWQDEDELHHHLFVSSTQDPGDLLDRTGSGLIACVWDLAVLSFERQAWVDTVLANPNGPDLGAYLATVMSADV